MGKIAFTIAAMAVLASFSGSADAHWGSCTAHVNNPCAFHCHSLSNTFMRITVTGGTGDSGFWSCAAHDVACTITLGTSCTTTTPAGDESDPEPTCQVLVGDAQTTVLCELVCGACDSVASETDFISWLREVLAFVEHALRFT
jgi:hypothetical protein